MSKVFSGLAQSYDRSAAKIQHGLDQLAPRDRLALIFLTIFLIITVIGCALWFTHKAASQEQQRLTELKDSIAWMQSNAVQFSTQSADGSTAIEKAQRLAQQQGLSIQVQDQQGQIQLIASHQNYAVLANYLTQLAQQGVSILQLDLQKQTDGNIQLKALLS